MIDNARDFLDAVAGGVRPPASEQRPASYDRPVRLGTIEPYYTAGLPKVLFDGEAVIGSKGYAWDGKAGYIPSSGERVFLIPVGQSFVIGGPISTTLPFLKQIALPFLLGTSQYPGYDVASFTKTSAGIVILKGMVYTPAGGLTAGSVVGYLPVGFRPDNRRLLPLAAAGNNVHGMVEIWPTGEIRLVTSVAGSNWYSLSGIRFPAAGVATWTPVLPTGSTGPAVFAANFSNWTNIDYGPAAYWVDPYGFVWWTGLIRLGAAVSVDNTNMVILSTALKPVKELHMVTTGGTAYSCIGVRPSDGLNWKTNSQGTAGQYMGLDSIVYPGPTAAAFTDVALTAPWTNVATAYPAGSYYKRPDGLVVLAGLLQSGSNQIAFPLPVGSRAAGRPIRPAVSNGGANRLDLIPDVLPANTAGWFSLDGHMFAAEA